MLNNKFSDIVEMPKDMESMYIISIFNSCPFEYGFNGVCGLKYDALKDAIRWRGLSPKQYVPILLSCFNYYMKGMHSKK